MKLWPPGWSDQDVDRYLNLAIQHGSHDLKAIQVCVLAAVWCLVACSGS